MQAPLLYSRSELTTVANLRKGGFYFFLGQTLLPKKDNLPPENLEIYLDFDWLTFSNK
jgi:hypothetical protein